LLVEVKASSVTPAIKALHSGKLPVVLPPLPVVMGGHSAGIIRDMGQGVVGLHPGEQVYVNPALTCGTCHYCHHGRPLLCTTFTMMGLFGYGSGSKALLARYPGGFARYLVAPARNVVKLPEAVSFEQGCKLTYLGTSYAALRAYPKTSHAVSC